MKKVRLLVSLVLIFSMLFATACGGGSSSSSTPADENPNTDDVEVVEGEGDEPVNADPVEIKKLSIAYVPSMDVDLILETTEPLKGLLIDALAVYGFNVGEVDISVGTSFEAVGEAVSAGSADIGFGGGSVYITYDDEVDLLLTATRYDFNKQGNDPNVWNEGETERDESREVTGYAGLIYAGPSTYGRVLQEKVASGEELTWEDLDGAVWAVANTTSNAGYLYPSLWLRNNYDRMLGELSSVLPGTGYPQMFAQAAAEQIDVFVSYADARTAYVDAWTGEMGRDESIWDEVKVIGVTDWMMNDVVIGSRTSDAMTVPGFPDAFCQAMMDISKTDEGFEAISIFSHVGYVYGNDADYNVMREVQEIVTSLD